MYRPKKNFVVFLLLVIAVIGGGFFIFPRSAQAINSDFYVTGGSDVSDGTARAFIASDLDKISSSDDSRMQSDGKWPEAGIYDEGRYIEFLFSPSVPTDATINSVTITHEYRRNGSLEAAKLEVWNGSDFSDFPLLLPSTTNSDLVESVDISSVLDTSVKVNSATVRFLAYRNDSGNTKTSHDLIKISVAYNRAPVAVDDEYITDEDTKLVIDAPGVLENDTDADGDALYAFVVEEPAHGTLDFFGDGSFTYMPEADYNGSDSFTYKAHDDSDDNSDEAVVTLTVNPVNDAPAAQDDAATADEDSSNNAIDVLNNDSDIEPDILTVTGVTAPVNGTAEIAEEGTGVSYTPNADYNGPDSFEYTISDGNGGTATATVTIDVNAESDAPALEAIDDQTVNELDELTFIASATDADGDAVTYSLDGAPDGALIDSNSGEFSWIPTEEQGPGDHEFNVVATDGSNPTSQTVNVKVEEVNTAPVASDISETAVSGVAKTIILSAADSDIPANLILFGIITGPSFGSVVLTGDQAVYTVSVSYNGADSFTYAANDGLSDSNTAIVSITVSTPTPTPTPTPSDTPTPTPSPTPTPTSTPNNNGGNGGGGMGDFISGPLANGGGQVAGISTTLIPVPTPTPTLSANISISPSASPVLPTAKPSPSAVLLKQESVPDVTPAPSDISGTNSPSPAMLPEELPENSIMAWASIFSFVSDSWQWWALLFLFVIFLWWLVRQK
ncbi:MAG: hypothetical protein A2750_02790 [Candidatus Yanofskybacteria bacterium RIFCSPHIGHO2_01_FULL_45_42]|uniref:Dystroglycan-type cadherin-like domain-containing protein n=1 Tax=Candidatus Yanofskybacteria bacterium RIFCSPHIGHO2_01_FULL_45_42 TaxID=1802671 RepID=A0A1F8F5G2_9BACT|nr:MAG: hypothetical protein A2750_02790 [Candidatus Yanofskybacteria bacterium RIFCSPHIGHO2_01_FULL_45_42]